MLDKSISTTINYSKHNERKKNDKWMVVGLEWIVCLIKMGSGLRIDWTHNCSYIYILHKVLRGHFICFSSIHFRFDDNKILIDNHMILGIYLQQIYKRTHIH